MQTGREWRSGLAVATVTGLLASLHALDLRIDSPATALRVNGYWALNIALFLWALATGILKIGSGRTRMLAALGGLVLGAVTFSAVMLARNADNNLLVPAVVVNFLVGAVFLGAGTGVGALLARLVRAGSVRERAP